MEAADHDEEPPQVTQLQQRNRYLRRALEKLSDRERVIIGARYALTEEEEQTLAMLAHRLNLSIERVRQIERAALQKLGHALADMGVSASSLF
jgi:RNA polymerase sigma factor (sigma-70 family)